MYKNRKNDPGIVEEMKYRLNIVRHRNTRKTPVSQDMSGRERGSRICSRSTVTVFSHRTDGKPLPASGQNRPARRIRVAVITAAPHRRNARKTPSRKGGQSSPRSCPSPRFIRRQSA
ncbi:unnamed protein product, partial [Nesidiocoris tenuis]